MQQGQEGRNRGGGTGGGGQRPNFGNGGGGGGQRPNFGGGGGTNIPRPNGGGGGRGPDRDPAGTECRSVGGACDVAEACTGVSSDCPADPLQPAGTPCRASTRAAGPCRTSSARSCTPPCRRSAASVMSCSFRTASIVRRGSALSDEPRVVFPAGAQRLPVR